MDTHGNGVQQITDFLAGHTGYSAVHIVSHGDTGEVFLGDSVLSDATLSQYGTQLQSWHDSLAPGADLLIYGCDVAAGTTGEHFISELGQLTGTAVTASTDVTGSARFGGDWVLEAQTGAIEARTIDFGATGWDGELATASFKAIYQGTPSAWSLQASNITLTGQIGAQAGSIKFVSADPSALYFSGNNVAGKLVYTGNSNVVHMIDGVVSRQFKTGGTTNAFYFYALGADGLVGGGDDTAYLIQVQNDTSTYTFDGSASALHRTSSDPVDTALNAIKDSTAPTLTAATSFSTNATPAIEAGGVSNGTAGQNGTGNVLDASLATGTGLSVVSVGTSAASQSGISASTTSSTGTAVTGSYGTLTLGSDGTYKYVVDNSNSTVQALRQSTDRLTDTFTYTVKDSSGNIASTTLTVTVEGQNDAPVANNDYNTTKIGGTAVTGNVLSNDTDVDAGDSLAISQLAASAVASSIVNTAGGTNLTISSSNGWSSVHNNFYAYYLNGATFELVHDGNGNAVTITDVTTYTLSAMPTQYYTASGWVALTSLNGATLGFDNTLANETTAGLKNLVIASSSSTASSVFNVSGVTGSIAVGMTASGTGVPNGTTVSSVTYDVNGNPTSVTLNNTITTANNGTINFSAAAGATITGRYGSLVLNTNGSYTYTPNASGANGTDVFSYTAQDLAGATSTATLNIQVLAAATSLTTVADTKSITVGTASVTGNVATNDTSTGGAESIITGSTAGTALNTSATSMTGGSQTITGQYGTLTLNSDGTYTYALKTDAATVATLKALGSNSTLTDSFQYLATNATAGAKSAAALTVTINGVNDAPTLKLNTSGSGSTNYVTSYTQGAASPTALVTLTGTHLADVDDTYFSKLTVSFTQSNFADGNSEQLSISGATGANTAISDLGGLANNATGTFTLNSVNYTYTVSVSGGVATLTFNSASAITQAQAETLLTALRYQNNSTNPTAGSNRVFSIAAFDNGSNNTSTLAGSGTLTSNVATSTITVYNTSTAPIATADTVTATEAGGTANGTAGTDPTGNVLTGETSNSTGTNIGDSGASITVTKAEAGSSIDAGASSVAAGSTSASNGTSVTGTYGTLVIGADGSYKYTVDNSNSTVQALQIGSSLTDTFSYQITDSTNRTATATLTVTINGANDAPTVGTAPTNQTATVNSAFSYTVPAFSDVDTGDTITYSYSGTLPAGITFDAATHTFSGTPSATQSAQTITVTGTDSKGATVSTTFTLTVASSTPTAPTASNDTATATEAGGTNNGTAGTDPTGNVKTNDTGTSITVTKAQAGSSLTGSSTSVTAGSTSASNGTTVIGTYGTLLIGADGSFKYTVNNSNATVQALQVGSSLTDTFSYQVADNAGQTATATLTVTINGANDAPTVGTAPMNQTATVGTPFSYTIQAFSDVDTADTITYSYAGTLPAGITFDAATRTFNGTPTAPLSAQTITITGTDSQGATVTTTFTFGAVNPAAPTQTVSIVSMTKDTGDSPTDFITGDGTAGRVVTGTISAPLRDNEVVQISFDGGTTWVAATTTGTGWTVNDNGSHNANWTIQARVVNTIANASGPASAQAVIYQAPSDNTVTPGSIIQLANQQPAQRAPTTSQNSGEAEPAFSPNTGNSPNSANGNANAADGDSAKTPNEGMLSNKSADFLNYKLELTGTLKNQLVLENKEFSFRIPTGVFTHTNPHEQLDFKATSQGGGPLPAWIHFDPNTKTFSGIPPVGSKTETVLVVVRDTNGKEVRAAFNIGIDRQEDVAQTQPDSQSKPVKMQARQGPGNPDMAAGKPGLAQQVRTAGRLSRLQESRALLNSLKQL